MLELTELSADANQIQELEGLQYARNLRTVDLRDNRIESIYALWVSISWPCWTCGAIPSRMRRDAARRPRCERSIPAPRFARSVKPHAGQRLCGGLSGPGQIVSGMATMVFPGRRAVRGVRSGRVGGWWIWKTCWCWRNIGWEPRTVGQPALARILRAAKRICRSFSSL